MSPKRLAAVLLFSAACSVEPANEVVPPPDTFPDFTAGAGARLSPQFVTSLDGEVWRFLQVVDSEFDQPCWLVESPFDNKVTCYPRAYGTTVFLDENCTKPYVATLQGDARLVGSDGYSPFSGTARIGARVTPPNEKRYMAGQNVTCFESETPPELPVYEILEFLRPETLGQGTIEDVAVSESLEAVTFVGDDGSSFVHHLEDRIVDTHCAPAMTGAGGRCKTHIGVANDRGLRDVECDRLVVTEYTESVVAKVPERGDQIYRFRNYGQPGRLGRVDEAGQCTVEPFELQRGAILLGEPYPEEEWPALEIKTAGSDRLTARVPMLPTGAHGEAESGVETKKMFEDRGVPCGPFWVDGTLRCLPAATVEDYAWATVFADPECTEPAFAMYPMSTPPEFVTWQDRRGDAAQGYLPVGRVMRVGSELRSVYRFTRGFVDCGPALLSGRFFRLEDEVAAENFVELRLVTAERP